MPKEINTLEEARAEILRLEEENTGIKNERDTLSQNNKDLSSELEKVRKLNQTYFNKLQAQYQADEGDKGEGDKDEPAPSCEDFAKTLQF